MGVEHVSHRAGLSGNGLGIGLDLDTGTCPARDPDPYIAHPGIRQAD